MFLSLLKTVPREIEENLILYKKQTKTKKNQNLREGGGVSTKPKVLRHFLFALKQSKANKCQWAKMLKTVKKLFLKFFVKEFWKK